VLVSVVEVDVLVVLVSVVEVDVLVVLVSVVEVDVLVVLVSVVEVDVLVVLVSVVEVDVLVVLVSVVEVDVLVVLVSVVEVEDVVLLVSVVDVEDVVVEATVVDVVLQLSGWQASAQVSTSPHGLVGGNASSHLSANFGLQSTAPCLLVPRHSTNPGRPQRELTSARFTSFWHDRGKAAFPTSRVNALRTRDQHCL
jgi:hypothetical protein